MHGKERGKLFVAHAEHEFTDFAGSLSGEHSLRLPTLAMPVVAGPSVQSK